MEAAAQRSEAEAWLLRLFARAIRPDRQRPLSEWAEAERIVAEGGYQGPWRNRLTPYLVEPMDYAGMTCPTPRVTFRGGAQIGKTQIGVNLAGQCLSETPTQAMVMLPSLTSLRQYNRDKLDRMIQATPALQEAVADITERSGQGSTTAVKRGARGAQVELVTASSSKDLQSRSVAAVIMEEIAEYDADVGGRGSPIEQGETRTYSYRKRRYKILKSSTPGIKGDCDITDAFEDGSQGRYHAVCPHCRRAQELVFANLTWTKGRPETAAYACAGCGTLIQEREKATILALENGAGWVHQHPERLGEHASFTLSALYSNMLPWSEIAAEAEAAEADPSKLKRFTQQTLGEPWDEAYELPKAELLMLRRDQWPVGRVPPGVLFLVGATDVQGAYLEWAVWGFDQNFTQYRIAGGTLHGDPTQAAVWRAHSDMLRRTWRDAWGRDIKPRSWGVDSSYLSSHVYAYVLGEAGRHDFNVMALDGRDGWGKPPIGKESWRRIRRPGQEHLPEEMWPKVPIYPVGTWDMKSELASALRLTEKGPGPDGWPLGALRFNEDVDKAWIEELLAERFVVDPKTGKREWKRLAARNEAWDLAVYCRAQARAMTLGMTPEQWSALVAETQGPLDEAQGDLLSMITPSLKAQAEAAAAAKIAEADARARADALAARRPASVVPEERFFDGAEDFWGDD
jgi:phage terminase large subunit GpA-like protein